MLQSWTKMLRKMDVKIMLLKALATTKLFSPLSPPPPKKNNVEGQVDNFWPWLNNFDQGGARGGVIAVPNPGDKHSVGKKVQNS